MIAESGYPFYGQYIGVLVFNGNSPRVPGDPGHAATFPIPTCYEVVTGTFADLLKGSEEIKRKLCDAVKNLENKGVRAVIGDCGLMALYQQEMAASSSLPILSSALVLVPLLWNLIGRRGTIGIITGHSSLLHDKHLYGAGIGPDIKLEIQGMEHEKHFREIIIDGGLDLNVNLMGKDILAATAKLLRKNKEVKVILLECSNLATYSLSLQEEYKLPVFDITGAVLMLKHAIHAPRYYDERQDYLA